MEYQRETRVMLTIRLAASNNPVGVTVTVKVHPQPELAAVWPGQTRSGMEASAVLLLSLRGPGRGSEKTLCEGV